MTSVKQWWTDAVMAATCLVVAVVLIVCAVQMGTGLTAATGGTAANSASPDLAGSAWSSLATQSPTPSVPESGAQTFAYASTEGAVLGAGGELRSFRVAVEEGVGYDPDTFASEVDLILGDERGWTADGAIRFQRLSGEGDSDFVIMLATPATSESICATAGLETERYTSCRIQGTVVINLARWLTSVEGYGATLDVYQAYVLNHEVGHELGNGHETCPGDGELAPVMMQQTLGLAECVAYGWPFLDGQRYSGPAVS